MTELKKKPLFNPEGDPDVRLRRMIGGNTTNLNDFNNMKYAWVSDWYRQAMNNFWIPEEINLSQDVKDYPRLLSAERSAYDKILSFLVFLDSIQTANLPNIGAYITANEVNLCLSIQAFQECVHSQSYSYMLDTICSPVERNDILYQWKTDEHLLRRNTFIGDCYNEFQERKDAPTLLRVMMANYILEGIYFYSGFMFFYNLSRNGKMPGSAQEIRYINRDENTHLWLFRNIITELQKEQPELFTAESVQALREMMREGVEQEIAWGHYVIGDDIPGLNRQMISDYIRYLGNLRWTSLGYPQKAHTVQTGLRPIVKRILRSCFVELYIHFFHLCTSQWDRKRPGTLRCRAFWHKSYYSLSSASACAGSVAASSIMPTTKVFICAAFCAVITGAPVRSSRAFRATPATSPPCRATSILPENPSGLEALEISRVDASASIVKTNSVSLMLSRRFSFFSPLRFLYCRVVMPDHVRVISSVRIANSRPFSTPRFCHSSVSSFRMRIESSL